MIIFFHFLFLFSKYIINKVSKSLSRSNEVTNDDTESTSSEDIFPVFIQDSRASESNYIDGNLRFSPPVYIQRYEAVYAVLREYPCKGAIKKIVDFGCSELSFFLYIKQMPGLEEILEIDIDEDVLERYITKATPLHSDYLLSKRTKPLNVYILAGDISEYDDYLLGTDAVVAIEVIEHLEPEVLSKVPHNIFHEIKPKLAIFTTPNADFNVLFPNFEGLRHADHKFEWSRKEFYKWTREIIKSYPTYSVKFYGIGPGPEGTENLGCCTQMAVFQRNEGFEGESSVGPKSANNYKLIKEYNYPFYTDTRTDEEKIVDEVLYRVKFSFDGPDYYNYEEGVVEVPLSEFMPYINELCSSEEQLKSILLDRDYIIRKKNGGDVFVYSEAIPDYSISEEYSLEYDQSENVTSAELPVENWDWDCGDGNFSSFVPDKPPEDELPNFFSARSVNEEPDSQNSKMHLNLVSSEHPRTMGDGNNSLGHFSSRNDNSPSGGFSMGDSAACEGLQDQSGSRIWAKIAGKKKIPGLGEGKPSRSGRLLDMEKI